MTRPVEPALLDHWPFPGLRPFYSGDRDFFFGREEQIYSLYRLIDHSRFVAVVGSSGSGKSSLVRAGLLPLLEDETKERAGRIWCCAVMRPGDAPMDRLADVLASLVKGEESAITAARRERLAFDLRRSSFGFADAVSKIKSLEGASLLLVVDQFEELFRYTNIGTAQRRDLRDEARSRDEATQFVQLLLEGSRDPAHNVHVLITMRSDFIGDCARFHGLPEAVSATQFLVPSLTRDQLEEVICKPLEKTGSTIEPALVERLLNDSSDDLDQLPVLQHCLLRLWERAGSGATTDIGLVRHLTIGHYESIGRIRGALSQHAEEILSGLRDVELAVEQTFRALSEIDREGRAIRRALPYSQLLDETGVPESDLRRVVDRFRSDDCSFLIPPLSEVLMLAPETRIDVGHEALLRRWERLIGAPDAIEKAVSGLRQKDIGWMLMEDRDGQRYRGLLSMLDDESADRSTLPLSLVNERWTWWNSRPRTAAWAARYGGRLDRVQRLFGASLTALRLEQARLQAEEEAERQRIKLQARLGHISRVAAVVVSGLLIIAIGLGIMFYRQAKIAERNYIAALRQTQTVVEKISQDLGTGAIPVNRAKEWLAATDATIRELQEIKQTQQATGIGVKILFAYSDSLVKLGDVKQALEKAQVGDKFAKDLAAAAPSNNDWQALIFGSAFRIGDALAQQGKSVDAMQEYRRALAIVQQGIANGPGIDSWQQNLIVIGNKIAETFQIQKNFPAAIEEFKKALAIAEDLATKDPANVERRRTVASTRSKIGKILAVKPEPDLDGALAQYDAALGVLSELAAQHPDDSVILSNLSHAHSIKGDLFRRRGDRNAAIAEYQSNIDIKKQLSDKDPGNAIWLEQLARGYIVLGNVLKENNDMEGAKVQYRDEFDIRQRLANKDRNNEGWQRNLQSSKQRLESLQTSDPQTPEKNPPAVVTSPP